MVIHEKKNMCAKVPGCNMSFIALFVALSKLSYGGSNVLSPPITIGQLNSVPADEN